jgi:hypothetical protein
MLHVLCKDVPFDDSEGDLKAAIADRWSKS